MHKLGTQKLYDDQAKDWSRSKPVLLSDYSARPKVISECGDVSGKRILDLGCGEGYVSRQLVQKGCESITGVDISQEMINSANEIKVQLDQVNSSFICSDVNSFLEGHKQKYDIVIAVFLFNYIDTTSMSQVINKVHSLLNKGGTFIFTVPHPSLPYIKPKEFPFYFDATAGYFSGRNVLFQGKIWRLDRLSVNVQCVHKTFTDYFEAIRSSPFEEIPYVEELHINEEHIALDSAFFEPLKDLPLHVLFRLDN